MGGITPKERWPEYLSGTRRYLLHHFPFSIVYLDDPDALTIVAVSHNKRRPGYCVVWESSVLAIFPLFVTLFFSFICAH